MFCNGQPSVLQTDALYTLWIEMKTKTTPMTKQSPVETYISLQSTVKHSVGNFQQMKSDPKNQNRAAVPFMAVDHETS